MNFAPWERATYCSGGARPGAEALLAWLFANYRPPGSSGGIYNCRRVAGTTSYSVHSEGRAVDWFMPTTNGVGSSAGTALVKRLGAYGKALGIQCIIYNRRIYSASAPSGRYYTGVHPHYDHIHIELTRSAGRYLTLATIKKYLNKPAPVPVTYTKMVVTATSLNVRSGPSTSHSIIGSLKKGAVVEISGTSNGWSKLKSGGYVYAAYLTKYIPPTVYPKYRVTATSLNVRKGPGTGYAIVGSYRYGTVVQVKSIVDGWAKLTSGYYVSARYLAKL